MADVQYPECEKWGKVHSDAVAILQFEEWCQSRPNDAKRYLSMQELVYEYFDIDPKKLEAERRTMLESLQRG